jgi:hypothetical protein
MPFGMDPEVTKYFGKIVRSLSAGLLWLLLNITFGIYFELAYSNNYASWVHIVFYIWLVLSLGLLLWYLYRIWGR